MLFFVFKVKKIVVIQAALATKVGCCRQNASFINVK